MSTVQAVIFSKKDWSTEDARKWLFEHDYRPIKRVDKTKNFLRYRLKDPKQFKTFRTRPLKTKDGRRFQLVLGFK